MSVPKIIHYCWFGSRQAKPAIVATCLASWRLMSDYTIIEWNEDNFDVLDHPYTRSMHAQGKFAFVSDFVRLKVLYDMGGIYLDTDVEVKKKFSEVFLEHKMFLPFQYDCALSTAIIGAERGNPAIAALLELYENQRTTGPNNSLVTNFFLQTFPAFRLNNRFQILGDGIAVYPKEYFDCPTGDPEMGYSVHHAAGLWQQPRFAKNRSNKIFLKLMRLGIAALVLIMGENAYAQYRRRRIARGTEFYATHLKHRNMR